MYTHTCAPWNIIDLKETTICDNMNLMDIVLCAVLNHIWLFCNHGTIAYQAPLSMDFPGKNTGVGLPFPSAGDLLNPGIAPTSPESSVLAGRFFTADPWGKPWWTLTKRNKPGTER